MRRDWDTVRRILQAVADAPGPLHCSALTTSEDDAQKVREHVRMMGEAGLIEVTATTSGPIAQRLTWEGQDLLASIAEPGTWDRVKARMTEVGGDCAVSTLKSLAVKAAAAALGL